jgi:hypothetical protein
MSHSESPTFRLEIGSGSDYRFATRVTVFSAKNDKLHSGLLSKPLSYNLPKGLYTIRVELNGKITDEVISLNKDTHVVVRKPPHSSNDWNKAKVIDLPRLYSSAPLQNANHHHYYASSFEYYTYPAVQHSRQPTCVLTGLQGEKAGSVFLFLRFPNKELYDRLRTQWRAPFQSFFRLLDDDGTELCSFSDTTCVALDADMGSVALHVDVPPGLYFLSYTGVNPRMVPVYVYKNWHTQLFLTLGAEPMFGTLRIFLSQDRNFNPDDINNQYIDILLDKLQNNVANLDDGLVEFSAHNKFESPMLALLCAYIYLQGTSTRKDNLINQMLYNLDRLILKDSSDSPDLRALDILAAKHSGDNDFDTAPVSGTPTFRMGFEMIRKASIEHPGLIMPHSLNDYLAEYMYFDSPYTTFKPVPRPRPEFKETKFVSDLYGVFRKKSFSTVFDRMSKKKKLTDDLLHEQIGDAIKNIRNTPMKKIGFIPPKETPVSELFGHDTIKSFIAQHDEKAELETGSWLTWDIARLIERKPTIGLSELSQTLQVSGTTISRVLEDFGRGK